MVEINEVAEIVPISYDLGHYSTNEMLFLWSLHYLSTKSV